MKNDFDIEKLRRLIERNFDEVNPAWREPQGPEGLQKRVSFNLLREGGAFDFGVMNAGDDEPLYADAIRRAIDEYARGNSN